jgi:hypothetical protein
MPGDDASPEASTSGSKAAHTRVLSGPVTTRESTPAAFLSRNVLNPRLSPGGYPPRLGGARPRSRSGGEVAPPRRRPGLPRSGAFRGRIGASGGVPRSGALWDLHRCTDNHRGEGLPAGLHPCLPRATIGGVGARSSVQPAFPTPAIASEVDHWEECPDQQRPASGHRILVPCPTDSKAIHGACRMPSHPSAFLAGSPHPKTLSCRIPVPQRPVPPSGYPNAFGDTFFASARRTATDGETDRATQAVRRPGRSIRCAPRVRPRPSPRDAGPCAAGRRHLSRQMTTPAWPSFMTWATGDAFRRCGCSSD